MRPRKAAEAAKKGRREGATRAGGGGKGCSELGTEIHYERREAGKWDSLGAIITKWTSPTRRLELSIKVSANPRRNPGRKSRHKSPPFFFRHWHGPATGRAGGSRRVSRGNWVECHSEWRWIIWIFCIGPWALYFQGGNARYSEKSAVEFSTACRSGWERREICLRRNLQKFVLTRAASSLACFRNRASFCA